MSLDSRLRTDLREIAATVDVIPEDALGVVLARRDTGARGRRAAPRLALAAASVLLLGALVVWWVVGGDRGGDHDVVVDPHPPAGTYEATLGGDLAGEWRLRFGAGTLSVLAPDDGAWGTRVATSSYQVHGRTLTTDLLATGPCTGPGTYTWTVGPSRLTFAVQDDDCALRVRLLTSSAWSTVSGIPLAEGTYETPALTIARLREAALAAGFAPADVDDELAGLGDARTVTYTLQVEGGFWTVYETHDRGPAEIGWSGPYTVVDSATVVAGEPPCGPITYDYRLDGDRVSFVLLSDACTEDGETAVGELIAQTTIYQTAPFVRVDTAPR